MLVICSRVKRFFAGSKIEMPIHRVSVGDLILSKYFSSESNKLVTPNQENALIKLDRHVGRCHVSFSTFLSVTRLGFIMVILLLNRIQTKFCLWVIKTLLLMLNSASW